MRKMKAGSLLADPGELWPRVSALATCADRLTTSDGDGTITPARIHCFGMRKSAWKRGAPAKTAPPAPPVPIEPLQCLATSRLAENWPKGRPQLSQGKTGDFGVWQPCLFGPGVTFLKPAAPINRGSFY